MEGTLPIWLIILLLGSFFMFALGYCKLYVSKANKEAVQDYRRGLTKDPPVVIVREHISPMACLNLAVLVVTTAVVAFFCQNFMPMLIDFGGGFLKGVFITLMVLVFTPVAFLGVIMLHLFGETVTAMSFEKLYKDRYGLKVRYEGE